MNESLIKYLAGLLDADGNLSFNYTADNYKENYFSLGLRLNLGAASSIDKHGFVASLPTLTGMGTGHSPTLYAGNGKYVNWQVTKRADLEMILPRLTKHMYIKARHWLWMMEIWRDVRAKEHGSKSIHALERATLEQAKKESRKFRVGPLKPKNFPSWAWLAGYLDGDGWYMHRNPEVRRYEMHVGACAHITDASVLAWLQNSFGGSVRPHSQSANVMQWRRSLSNADRSFALRFLPKLVKHSRLKRHKIELMIHHHQQRLSALSSTEQATV